MNARIDIHALRETLLGWFFKHRIDYPWRQTSDPYAILVSEMMLQQTQVATVLRRGYFASWMERFPNLDALADAGEPEVLALWEGLGYYNRARNLQRTAKVIVDQHGGQFPTELEEIEALPGIGRYTAAAVYSFAYDLPAPLVDANVARLIARLYAYEHRIDTSAGQRFLWTTAEQLLDQSNPRAFNSALMELGQAVCKPRDPRCRECVLSEWCAAYQSGGDPKRLPLKKPKRATVDVDEYALFAQREDGAVLLHQGSGSRRRGLWTLPLRDPTFFDGAPTVYEANYGITHHRVRLRVYRSHSEPLPQSGDQWILSRDLAALPMASPFRKALGAILDRT